MHVRWKKTLCYRSPSFVQEGSITYMMKIKHLLKSLSETMPETTMKNNKENSNKNIQAEVDKCISVKYIWNSCDAAFQL